MLRRIYPKEELIKANICVVIPAYLAEHTIEKVLNGIPDYVSSIIVVDDASPDTTGKIVLQCQSGDKRITLLTHPENQGVGGAVKTGYQLALEKEAGIIVKMDSDDQMDPSFLPSLLTPILAGEADFTKGNRFTHQKELMKMPWVRRIGNLGLSFLTKAASGYWNIFDPTNGYTAISRDALSLLEMEKLAQRYYFEISLLQELGRHRLVVEDIFIPAKYNQEVSSLSPGKLLLEFPQLILTATIKRILYLYFVRDFTAASLFIITGVIGILFGIIWGGVFWIRSVIIDVPATTGTVMISVLPLIIGLQLLLQAIVMDIQNIPTRKSH